MDVLLVQVVILIRNLNNIIANIFDHKFRYCVLSIPFSLNANFIKINLDWLMQLYNAYPCDGTCANNYGGDTYCYAPPKYYNLDFNIQIGINFYFFFNL